jgi:hypothetical protein
MGHKSLYSTLAFNLAFGACSVTLFLLTGNVTDPVNATKFLILGGLALSCLLVVGTGIISGEVKISSIDMVVFLFVVWGLVAVFTSKSPISQNFYGVYGRNTGWLAYFFFAIIFLTATKVREVKNFNLPLFAFGISAVINVVYNSWVIIFGDFIGWQNNYGAILGTFGNPNFASSFLGITFSLNLVMAIRVEKKYKLLNIILIPVIAWQLLNSGSIQGNVVALIGSWIVGLFWIKGKFSQSWVWIAYFNSGLILAFLGIVGVFGRGPFREILAQPTIALREQYWLAALNMAKSNPVHGVGMDSYGDWYRRSRDAQALILPGPETVTNAAHSIYLDLLAYGGFPLIVLYLTILMLTLRSILRVIKNLKSFDSTFVALTVMWACYQIQGTISINQIGLGIWGWLSSGLLIAYERNLKFENEKSSRHLKKNGKTKQNLEVLSPKLFAFVGLIIGLIIAAPPINADLKWSAFQKSGNVDLMNEALAGTYLVPLNSYRLAQAVELLENSQMPEIAIKFARKGVQYNPNSFTAWQTLYLSTNSTLEEKRKALRNMTILDPLNQSWKRLK